MSDTPKLLYSVRDAAEALGLSLYSVRRFIRRGELDARRLTPNGTLRIRADELQRFIASRPPR